MSINDALERSKGTLEVILLECVQTVLDIA